MSYVLHFLIGVAGAGAAYLGRHFCPHRKHQIIVSAALIAVEAIASVSLIG